MSSKNTYFVVIQDNDQKLYAVSPPVLGRYVDDWSSSINEAQANDRYISWADVEDRDLEAQIELAKRKGYTEVSASELILVPRDRTNDFVGNLHAYAKSADRTRIVKVLCKGECRMERYSEVNKPFPSIEVLHKAEMGEYKAKCLKCGSTALDNYNWYR